MYSIPTLLIIAIAIALGFFVQTIVGFAAVLVALPILLIVLDLQSAIVILSLLLALFSVILIFQNHDKMDKRIILELAISGFIGMIIGIYTLEMGKPEVLKRMLGGFIIIYALHAKIRNKKIVVFQNMGWLFGLVGGYFSGLFNTGGPLYVTYVNPLCILNECMFKMV